MKLLAAQAAVAVENARLYESDDALVASARVAERDRQRAGFGARPPALLELIAARLRELVQARLVLIALPDGPSRLRVQSASGAGEEEVLGMTLELATSKLGRVFERGRSERVDSLLDDPEVDQQAARRFGATTGLYVPLVAQRPVDRRPERVRQAGARPTLHRGRPPARRGLHGASGDRRRSLRAHDARRAPPRRRGAGARAAPAGARAARRDRPGSHLPPARPADARGSAWPGGSAAVGGRAARSRRDRSARRPPARGGAPPEGARRLRPRPGARAARDDVFRADRDDGRARGPARREAARPRGGDCALPHRPGGAHEHGEARAGTECQHPPHVEGREGGGRDRRRRPRLRSKGGDGRPRTARHA